MHSYNLFWYTFDKVDNFTLVVLTIIVPVFDLAMLKPKSGKCPEI